MFFRLGSELAGVSGKLFPRPALLFVVRNGTLFVRALPTSERPQAGTNLAAAPYWNIDSNGAVCAGTMRAPNSLTVGSVAAWQQAFFQSQFTHPGVPAEQWIKEGKQAVKMTRLSCHRFRSNEVRLALNLLAYNLGNFVAEAGAVAAD